MTPLLYTHIYERGLEKNGKIRYAYDIEFLIKERCNYD